MGAFLSAHRDDGPAVVLCGMPQGYAHTASLPPRASLGEIGIRVIFPLWGAIQSGSAMLLPIRTRWPLRSRDARTSPEPLALRIEEVESLWLKDQPQTRARLERPGALDDRDKGFVPNGIQLSSNICCSKCLRNT